MRSSTVIILAALAAVPAFSAPVTARHDEESGAVKINSGLVKDVVEIGNGIITGAQGIKSLFHSDQ